MVTTPDPLVSDAPLIVYLDIKSPYAYLATFPTMDLEDRLGVEFDWRPLTLDIPSFLGSAKLDAGGKVAEQSRSEEQWRSVKYAYADCRRYGALRDRTIRGTVKIWDTSLVHMGMMWAKRQGHQIHRQYIQKVYEPFWRREFDADDTAAVERTLATSGADIAGFASFCEGEGRLEHDQMQREIFDAGIFGIPGYVIDGEILFGRENLPRVEWLLQGGDPDSAPDICYRSFDGDSARDPFGVDALEGDAADAPSGQKVIHVLDFSQPESYLAHQPTRELADRFGVAIAYRPFSARGPMKVEGGERTGRHLAFRAEHAALQLELGAASQSISIHRRSGGAEAAHCALLWLEESRPQSVATFVEGAFEAYWRDGRDLDDTAVVSELLETAGAPASEFSAAVYKSQLSAVREELTDAGVVDAPGYLLDGEFFLGRGHLPLMLWRLSGEKGVPPL